MAAAALAPVLLAGCLWAGSGPGPYVPEVAGIVTARESAGGGLTRYTLANGQTFTLNELDGSAYDSVFGAGPLAGDLLLAGHRSGRPWLAMMPPGYEMSSSLPVGCYELISRGTDRGDSIQTDVGLTLTKAPDFDAGLRPDTADGYPPTAHPGMRYEQGPLGVFCLDDEGLVTAAR